MYKSNLCYLRPPRRVKGLRTHENVQGQVASLHGVEKEAVPCVGCVCFMVCGASVGIIVACAFMPIVHQSYSQRRKRTNTYLPSSSTTFSRSRSFFFFPNACFVCLLRLIGLYYCGLEVGVTSHDILLYKQPRPPPPHTQTINNTSPPIHLHLLHFRILR
jgi:hypothetical protein